MIQVVIQLVQAIGKGSQLHGTGVDGCIGDKEGIFSCFSSK